MSILGCRKWEVPLRESGPFIRAGPGHLLDMQSVQNCSWGEGQVQPGSQHTLIF